MKASVSASSNNANVRTPAVDPPPPRIAAARWSMAFAAVYAVVHLPSLAPSLEDIDSINFALGLHDFSPALHQPHPPGYPVYIALGRISHALLAGLVPSLSGAQADAVALALWSVAGGALAIYAAARLFTAIAQQYHGHPQAALWATALFAAAPLAWISGLRPMSDLPGLSLALFAQALIVEGRLHHRRLLAGALLAGLAAGIRVQTLALTAPLILLAAVSAARGRPLRTLVTSVAAGAAGCLMWAVPLVVVTGGVRSYVDALGSQAGEDFAWVDMLWMNPTPRRLAFSLYETFVMPWGSLPLAVILLVVAAVGAGIALVRWPRSAAVAVAAFGPYAVYHLLFQETVTVRYALPVLPLVAWFAANGVVAAGRATRVLAIPLIAAALLVAVPGGFAYGREPHPAFRAIADAVGRAASAPPAHVYSHYSLRRPLQTRDAASLPVVEPALQNEWLAPADYWRGGGTDPVWFLADPTRSDLALIDPASRRDVVRYRWPVSERLELSGTRPLGVDWYRLPAPGWFTGEGWSLTPETGGIVRAAATGPDHRPIEAWVRRRSGPLHLVIGGRHLGDAGDPAAEFELTLDGVLIDRWRLSVAERNFLRFIDLPEGLPPRAAGDGPAGFSDRYARLIVASRSADGDGRSAAVAVRQFDVQSSAQLISGFGEGWHEEEATVQTGLRWRWTSERAILRVHGPSRAIRLLLRGESPMKYFDSPPRVTVVAGGRTVGETRPAGDFEWSVDVPSEAWLASGGAIAIETDRVYLPGQAEGTSDERHLGLRLFETSVTLVSP